MSVEIDLSGLEKLQRNLEKVDGEHDVPMSELFPDPFMHEHTNFQTFQALLDAGGIKEKEEIGSEAFSALIAANSQFDGWRDMFETAGREWMIRQLGF